MLSRWPGYKPTPWSVDVVPKAVRKAPTSHGRVIYPGPRCAASNIRASKRLYAISLLFSLFPPSPSSLWRAGHPQDVFLSFMSTMLSLPSPIPQICISPAPREDPPPEPYSPFTPASFATPSSDAHFRSHHLTPPPTFSSFGRSLSPLRPTRPEQGLERTQFEALLQASRERSGTPASKREQDLRREIALRTHKTKQRK